MNVSRLSIDLIDTCRQKALSEVAAEGEQFRTDRHQDILGLTELSDT